MIALALEKHRLHERIALESYSNNRNLRKWYYSGLHDLYGIHQHVDQQYSNGDDDAPHRVVGNQFA